MLRKGGFHLPMGGLQPPTDSLESIVNSQPTRAWMQSCNRTLSRIGAVGVAAALVVLAGCQEGPEPPPPQPIAFNHSAHIENDVACTECHEGVETQAEAGLPPISTCASCHRRTIPDHPEVVRFMEYYQNDEPIVWRKVNALPESAMVHFNHAPHIRAGVDCATCHGDVGQMTVAQAVLNVADMGWCVSCHQENQASSDCLTCHH